MSECEFVHVEEGRKGRKGRKGKVRGLFVKGKIMCERKWELGGREEEICGERSKGLNF